MCIYEGRYEMGQNYVERLFFRLTYLVVVGTKRHEKTLFIQNKMADKNQSYNKIDFRPWNISSDWKRIELPHAEISRDPELYLFFAIFIMMTSIPLNCFLIVQILR